MVSSQTGIAKERIKPAVQSLLDEVRAIPQVEAAAATTNIIISGGSWTLGLTGELDGTSKFTWVSPGYFTTLESPLRRGRDFSMQDVENGPKVVIVNETFAKRYFPGVDPIGKTFRSKAEPGYPEAQYRIVGLCRDTRYYDLRDTPPPQSFAPISQHPSYGPFAAFYVRSSARLGPLSETIHRRIAAAHPGYSMDFRIFETQVRDTLVRERLLAVLSGFFGLLALLLATIGLYGVIAYLVSGRRNEIGIRTALGATPGMIVALFLREAALLTAVGMTIGTAGAYLFASSARTLLFGFSSFDPAAYLSAMSVLAGAAALGSYLPARRAARMNAVTALNCE
ncbi:MAG: FtsX-like permease family protein [Bryobacteraceae bacterium]